MTIWINPWMRCECGKLHLRSHLSPNSACSCGRPLWSRAWDR